jgi:hypothetical protein
LQPYHREDPAPDVIGDDRIGPVTEFSQRLGNGLARGLRRHARAVLIVLGLAAVAVTAIILTAPKPALQPARAGGVFASGTAHGHLWRLAVQDIADPGYRCLPAITLNGTDADPVYPLARTGAAVTVGPSAPGVGFAFVELPAASFGVTVNGRHVPGVYVTACGYRYRLTGFAYPLPGPPRITLDDQPTGETVVLPLLTFGLPAVADESDGLWINTGTVPGPTAWQLLAQGELVGRPWTIRVQFGSNGDCYQYSSPGFDQVGACGPVGTPSGPETLMALPLSLPGASAGTTGYGVQVSPGTARLRAVFSDGSVMVVTPRVVAGRRYAAFVVPPSHHLDRLVWLDAAGRVIASTAAVPPFGYIQVQT